MTAPAPGRFALFRPEGIPNLLTALRILTALAFPLVPRFARLAIVGAALVTEYLDGALARRFGWESRSGRLLDPIADKIFFGIVAATLLVEGRLSWFELLALGIRDLAVLLAVAYLSLRRRWKPFLRMNASFLGKLTTALQYVALFVLLLDHPLPRALTVLLFLLGALAAFQSLRLFRSPRP